MAFVAFFLATALDFWILDFAFALALAFALANAFRGLAALALALANAFRGLAALALVLALALAQVLRPGSLWIALSERVHFQISF